MLKRRDLAVVGMVAALLVSARISEIAFAAELKQAVEQLAVQLAKSAPAGRTLRVAVTDFPDLQGVTSSLGRYIAELATGGHVNSKFSLRPPSHHAEKRESF